MSTLALPLWCEHKIADIMHRQEAHGVRFNKERAGFLIHRLTEEILKIDRQAVPQLPLMMLTADHYKLPFLKSGKLAKWPTLYCETHGLDPSWVGGPFSRVWFTPFDMSKTDKVKRALIDYGWIPDEWNTKDLRKGFKEAAIKAGKSEDQLKDTWIQTYITKNFIEERSTRWKEELLRALKFRGSRTRGALANHLRTLRFVQTSPKLTESSLTTVKGSVGKLLMRRVVLSHRRSLLLGLLTRLREDGRLGAGCNPCATPTFRANYKVVVNIPAARSDYGKEIRELFIPDSSDHVFLGSDASGLEARMLAHYMNDPMYTDILLNGDIHSYNQQLAGLPTRDDAKTFIYALMYGAGDGKLGEIVGGTQRDGTELRARFMAGLPNLAKLIDRLTKEAQSGQLVGLDGRILLMRRGEDGNPQTHKALNTLLQAAGAIVMKYGMIFLDHWTKEAQLDAHQVIWMHDEVQWSVHKKDVEQLTHYANNYVRVAGEYLNMNLPLASDAMVGKSWYSTH